MRTLETDDRSSGVDNFFDGRLSDDVLVVISLSRLAKSQTLAEGVAYKLDTSLDNSAEALGAKLGCLLIKFQRSDSKIPLKTLETDDRSSDIDDFFDGRLSDDVVVVVSLSRVVKSQTLVDAVEYSDCLDSVFGDDTLGESSTLPLEFEFE